MKQINRREFLRTTSLTLGAFAFTAPNLNFFSSKTKKPNLLYIFADQLRADVLGYAGDKKAITPNIDRFASQAVNFSNAVSVTPLCAPHRASLITGKYTSSTGMVINELNMNPNHRTISHVLNNAGYNLGYIGKWHLNDQHTRPTPKGPERLGFDGFWAAYSFNHQSYKSYYYTDDRSGNLKKVSLEGKHGPTEFTNLAIDYIEKASEEKNPFAMFLSWNPPHPPWRKDNVPTENYEKFRNVKFELPPNFMSTPDKYMDRYPSFAFKNQKSWKKEFLDGGLQEFQRWYYAMVNQLDEQFGRIITKLDELGLTENTIVVFSSDHGEMFGSQGRMFKLTFYDEAARVPFLIRYPQKIKSGESDACINTPDIMPTLLGLMGLHDEIPNEVEGVDLSFILRKETGLEPEGAFLQGMGHTFQWKDGYEWRSIRDKRFTYAKYLRDGKELLYDRKVDPYMIKDVLDDPSYNEELTRLRKMMLDKMRKLNDKFHKCTWYRDHWMYKNYSIKTSAGGEFGSLPPIEPNRK